MPLSERPKNLKRPKSLSNKITININKQKSFGLTEAFCIDINRLLNNLKTLT
jgi:hypothetical protein